ncbi:prepilin-type N-terminal cleavage/methylation domain-containing protein [Gracilibacillus oryzae]|uniref:Prepilin-type N-terminal cleavage/methylation domain-containing protein n=1 Tax=Gracilibacillus oryzae TaxID=1672701 RepID=A0A7C8GUA3_9BACI|nr:prepilin-type N-terminal cleavage/methylation domain-containing protein [Gracilibacillus oryzae]KAB8137491.1 prepilin-type N-terminal cleavage/methylation domain-containing protein [Gracilibacillus oryzae]
MFKSEKGITLVELLAALALMSVIIALISSVHLFGQKQYRDQTAEISNYNEVRTVIALITSELRSTSADLIKVEDNTLKIDEDLYSLSSTHLNKNGQTISSQISEFSIKKTGTEVDISVTSTEDNNGNTQSITTTIYLRE